MSRITQDALIADGFEVGCQHFRAYHENGKLSATGGHTTVSVFKNGREAAGFADCSVQDCFNRKIGFQIAAGRALKQFKNGAVTALKHSLSVRMNRSAHRLAKFQVRRSDHPNSP